MIALYVLIAVFIAWIWVDYYRLIDIYERDSLSYFIITFLMGGLSVFIVFFLTPLLQTFFNLELRGDFANDFLYCSFIIGAVEEMAKMVPFLLAMWFFKSRFNEPIDYLAFICASALGFSATENVLYFYSEGPYIINGRAILSTVGHMFNTALIAYGFILNKYRYGGSRWIIVFLFFLLAALSHGFYDFWLLYEGMRDNGWIVTVVYFLVTVSWFAVILNNALNNSGFFTYKKIVNSGFVARRLLVYYAIVFMIQLLLLSIVENVTYAISNFVGSLYTSGFIVVVTSIRLSRFKLIKQRWFPLKLELPFSFGGGDAYGGSSGGFIRIKGDTYNEIHINRYYEEFLHLHPLSGRSNSLGRTRLAFIESKIFLKNDQAFYLARVYEGGDGSPFEKLLLKPKTSGTTFAKDMSPIVAVLKIEKMEDLENLSLEVKHFKFLEWGVVRERKDSVIDGKEAVQ